MFDEIALRKYASPGIRYESLFRAARTGNV